MSKEPRAGGGAWWRRKRPVGDGAGELISAERGDGLWAVGEVIADLYEVKAVHGQGGMGVVYRVRHRGWDTDLAVKSPRADVLRGDGLRRFVDEAETWVSMGLHPHVCACHYVRVLDGLPRVFAEYVDGGSLRDWIDDRRLYRGGASQALARILDVAIQTAWGLAHAHRRGVVHQDVKPGNVLLNKDGVAKVTDFGLARAGTGALPASAGAGDVRSLLVSVGGLTPAYASPEQAAGQRVGRRSDIWSFAVSVLELFTGGVTWQSGIVAGAVLRQYREDGPADASLPRMPRSLAELLAGCLDHDPGRRPASMDELAAQLAAIHQRELGRPYHRVAPDEARLQADELNNHALSLLDLGQPAAAAERFADALAADPRHPQATYNFGLLRWRAGIVDDETLVAELDATRTGSSDAGLTTLLLAEVHLERGDVDAARAVLAEADRDLPDGVEAIAGRLLRTARGHQLSVVSVGLSDGGRTVVSGGQDRRIRIWDAGSEDAARVVRLDGRGSWFRAGPVAGARRAVGGGDDGHVRVWELDKGTCVATLEGHTSRVTSVSLSGDERRAVSAGDDGTLRVWDLDTGLGRSVRHGHSGSVNRVGLSADGRLALSGGRDGTVRLWDVTAGSCLRTFEGQAAPVTAVTAVALSADGQTALAGHADGALLAWQADTGSGRHVATMTVAIHGLAMHPSAGAALVGGADGKVRLVELDSGRCRRTFAGHGMRVSALAVSDDGRTAVSGSDDNTTRLWQLPGAYRCAARLSRPRSHAELRERDAQVRALRQEAEHALAAGRFTDALHALSNARMVPGHERSERLVAAWRVLSVHCARTGVRSAWPTMTIDFPTKVTSLSLDHSGSLALAATVDGTVRLWHPETLRTGPTLGGAVTFACLTPDGRRVLAGRRDAAIDVWDLDSGKPLRTLNPYSRPVRVEGLTAGYEVQSLHPSDDGRHVLAGGQDSMVRLWDVETGECVRSIATLGSRSVHLDADGRHAVTGGSDAVVRLWDLTTGDCVRTFEGHTDLVLAVCAHPGSRTVIAGARDSAVRLWDLDTGACRHVLTGHTRAVRTVQVSPDGRFAFTGSDDGTVRIWDLTTAETVRVLDGHVHGATAVALDAAGTTLLTGSAAGTLRRWTIDWVLAERATG